jgi:hypothetical protein
MPDDIAVVDRIGGAFGNEFPRRERQGINRKILIAPRGGELNLYPPLEGSSAAGGLKQSRVVLRSPLTAWGLPFPAAAKAKIQAILLGSKMMNLGRGEGDLLHLLAHLITD